LFMNLFIPSMKIQKKTRIGSRIRKIYGSPKTPLERAIQSGKADPDKLAALIKLRDSLDPLALSKIIDQKLIRIHKLANQKHSPQSNSSDR